MNEPTGKAWNRPELIVIVRGGREEAVLTTCKLANTSFHEPDPGTTDQSCLDEPGGCLTQCTALEAS
jgi:hypothetical protein